MSVTSLPASSRIQILEVPAVISPESGVVQKEVKIVYPPPSDKKRKKRSTSDLIPLHAGSHIKISKTKLLEIYTEHPALYTIRLATIVFGKEKLSAVSKESQSHAIDLLDQDILNSLICRC